MNSSKTTANQSNISVFQGIFLSLKRLSAPVVMILGILGTIAAFNLDQAATSIEFTLEALLSILPFLILSVVIAAGLKASGADQIVAKAFEGRPVYAIAIASLFGALSPFCSCGVVPLVAGLLAAGVPIAPVLAFTIASPIMDPEMFILTAAGLGLELAVVKTIAAIMMGLFTGYTTLLISRTGYLNDALKTIAKPTCSSGGPAETQKVYWRIWRDKDRMQNFWRQAGTSGWFLGKWITFAFLLESLMVAYIPGDLVAAWLGDNNPYALPLAMVVGVPAYLNGYAAIPLVRGLLDLGMSPATGLTFLLAGSVTSIPAAIAIWTLAKPRLFALYLGFAATGSLLSGFSYLMWLSLIS
ncbi:MAG: permease [Sneathiella sp.]|nr:permease [Sneathiella sp.]